MGSIIIRWNLEEGRPDWFIVVVVVVVVVAVVVVLGCVWMMIDCPVLHFHLRSLIGLCRVMGWHCPSSNIIIAGIVIVFSLYDYHFSGRPLPVQQVQ